MWTRTWVKPSCELPSGTSGYSLHPIEGTNSFLHRQLARQSWAASVEDRLQIGSSIMPSDFTPGQSFTFGSLTFVADGAGRLDINPPPAPARTIFFGTLAFVVDRYGDHRLCVPPPHRAASAASTEPAPATPASDPQDDDISSPIPQIEARITAARPGRCTDSTTTH